MQNEEEEIFHVFTENKMTKSKWQSSCMSMLGTLVPRVRARAPREFLTGAVASTFKKCKALKSKLVLPIEFFFSSFVWLLLCFVWIVRLLHDGSSHIESLSVLCAVGWPANWDALTRDKRESITTFDRCN